MKTIGLIGGLSWESSIEYYRIVNELVAKRLGGQHSCQCVMYSVDLDPILILRDEDNWDKLNEIMKDAVLKVEAAGADFSVICSNTMHKSVDFIKDEVSKPILHITDVTGAAINAMGLKNIGLMGTKFTLTQDFYSKRLQEKFGLNIIIPDEDDILFMHHVIYDELDFGVLNPASKQRFVEIIARLKAKGAEGVILGCTEIPLLVQQQDADIPLFDTTTLHATAAVDLALA